MAIEKISLDVLLDNTKERNYIGKNIDDVLGEIKQYATAFGISTVQVRKPSAVFDCRFDTSRLSVYVDENKSIESFNIG